ncbi:MAG: hypothetical protein K0R08_765 [Solimicrobium sp.]|nr:hypothetical protein [Solimicrobium sp.]
MHASRLFILLNECCPRFGLMRSWWLTMKPEFQGRKNKVTAFILIDNMLQVVQEKISPELCRAIG